MYKIIFTFILLVLPYASSRADVKLYLIPRAFTVSNSVKVMDIARIEGAGIIVSRIGNEVLDSALYSDGFIDRNELRTAVEKITGEIVQIYGSASRIYNGVPESSEVDSGNVQPDENLVKNGERVKLIIRKNGIRIEVAGKAGSDGSLGKEIQVRLKNNRLIRGRITGKNSVEVNL